MIVELLQPAGPDLARRWLAALLLVDRADRESLVESIERQVVEAYATPTQAAPDRPPHPRATTARTSGVTGNKLGVQARAVATGLARATGATRSAG